MSIFRKNNNFHQIGNAYLEFDIKVRDTAGAFTDANVLRLITNALGFCFKEARLAATGGSDVEHIKNVGQVNTIMQLLTSKDSDLSSCFDKSGENVRDGNIVLKRILTISHTDTNKSKHKGKQEVEHIFGFCKTFKKNQKSRVSYHDWNCQSTRYSFHISSYWYQSNNQ